MATTSRPHDYVRRRAESPLPPSRDGSVVMDVGGDIGALVLYTRAELLGAEIDLFEVGSTTPLVHTAIRERQLQTGTIFAGVYPGIPAGDYTVGPHGSLPALPVTIQGGVVTEVHGEHHRRSTQDPTQPD